jgi:hypothetical protein
MCWNFAAKAGLACFFLLWQLDFSVQPAMGSAAGLSLRIN